MDEKMTMAQEALLARILARVGARAVFWAVAVMALVGIAVSLMLPGCGNVAVSDDVAAVAERVLARRAGYYLALERPDEAAATCLVAGIYLAGPDAEDLAALREQIAEQLDVGDPLLAEDLRDLSGLIDVDLGQPDEARDARVAGLLGAFCRGVEAAAAP